MTDRYIVAAGTTGAGSGLWLTLEAIRQHGPSWPVVPPLLMGVSSLVMAVVAMAKSRREELAGKAEERRREELHRARMASLKPGVEPLPDR